MKTQNQDTYQKSRKIYSYLIVVPRALAILYFIGQILVQSSIKFNQYDTKIYVDSRSSLGLIFSSSALSARCISPKYDLKRIYSVSAVVTIALGLFRVFASYFAGKGKGRILFFAGLVELLDFLRLIPCIVLSVKESYPLIRSLTDRLVNGIIHVLGIGLLAYSQVVVKRIHDYEVAQGEIKE